MASANMALKPRAAKVAAEAPAPPPELKLELDADLERSVYEHGLRKYLKKPPSYLHKPEMGMSMGAPPSPQSCLRRNLPGILIITIVLFVAAVAYIALEDVGGSAASSVYPTPKTTATTKEENATSTSDDVKALLEEAQNNFLGRDEATEDSFELRTP